MVGTKSIITSIVPCVSKARTSQLVSIFGKYFTNGGAPKLLINDTECDIISYSDTEITFMLTEQLSRGLFVATVLNGSEQIM